MTTIFQLPHGQLQDRKDDSFFVDVRGRRMHRPYKTKNTESRIGECRLLVPVMPG
jgi:hypothetical protein